MSSAQITYLTTGVGFATLMYPPAGGTFTPANTSVTGGCANFADCTVYDVVSNSAGYGAGTYVATQSNSVASMNASFAFDNNLGMSDSALTSTLTYYSGSGSYTSGSGAYSGSVATTAGLSGAWLQLQPPVAMTISCYAIQGFPSVAPGTPLSGSGPSAWTVLGSQDNTNWTVLDMRSNMSIANYAYGGPTTFVFCFPPASPTLYTYFRFVWASTNGATSVAFTEVRLFGGALPSPPPPPPSPSPPPYNQNCADVYDYGFGPSLANGTTLQSWLGASTGYVNMWYDQSGRNRHAYADSQATAPVVRMDSQKSWALSFNGGYGLKIYSGSPIPNTMAAEVVFSLADGFNSTPGNVATLFGSSATTTSLRLQSGKANALGANYMTDWSTGATYYINGFQSMSVPTSGQNAIDISGISPIVVDSIGFGYGCTSCNFSGTMSELILYPNVLTNADVSTLIADSFSAPPPPAVTGAIDGGFEGSYAGISQVCGVVAGAWTLSSST